MGDRDYLRESNRDRQAETDALVEELERERCEKRERLFLFYKSFIDHEPRIEARADVERNKREQGWG